MRLRRLSRLRKLQRRLGSIGPLVMGIVTLFLLFIAAIFGYMRIEGWSFWDSVYMVVISLSTVGFQEVHPLSPSGRIFTSGLIIMGVGNFAFLVGSFTQILVEGHLHNFLRRRKVQNIIDKLKDHTIVCGFGRTGSVVAREILEQDLPVVVIESDPAMLQQLEEEGILHLAGDATSDELLLAAGLKRARSLVTSLSQDTANLFVVLTARQLNPTLTIVSRASSESHITRLERAGANRVVLPHHIGGVRMAQSVLRPNVTTFMEMSIRGRVDLQMEELLVTPGSDLVGKNLIESEIRQHYNIIIIAIKKRDGAMIFNPAGDYVIQAWDMFLSVGSRESLNEIRSSL